MLKKAKKKALKTAMKLMANEKVAKTVMKAMAKKNDLNEKLARLYATVQLPSLADHDSLTLAMDRVRRRVKNLEKDINQAEFAMEKVESVFERIEILADQLTQRDSAPVPEAAQKPPAPLAATPPRAKAPRAKKTAARPKAAAKPEPVVKPAKAKKSAAKPKLTAQMPRAKSKGTIAPLGATGNGKPAAAGLLNLDFKKSGAGKPKK